MGRRVFISGHRATFLGRGGAYGGKEGAHKQGRCSCTGEILMVGCKEASAAPQIAKQPVACMQKCCDMSGPDPSAG